MPVPRSDPTHRPASLRDYAYDALRTSIVDGTLAPGSGEVLPLALDTSRWREVPQGLDVHVATLDQQENGCLDVEARFATAMLGVWEEQS